METKANYLMIGGFVIGLIVLGFLFAFWISGYGAGGRPYYILFRGTVAGLTSGSEVSFNGIKVGQVKSIALDPKDARNVLVMVTVRNGIPVRTNSHASIAAQGLTGGSGIEISPGTPDAPLLVATKAEPIPYIKADLAVSQSLFAAAPQVMGNANAVLGRLNNLLADNQDSIHKSLNNIEQLTDMLAKRKQDISQIIVNARIMTTKFRDAADKMDQTISKIQSQLTDDKTGALVQAKEAATSLRQLADKLNKSFGDNAAGLTRSAKVSLQEFNQFMQAGRHAAQTMDDVLQKFERNPKEFLLGGNQVPEYTPKGSAP